jgi:hypothetical protein
MSALPWPRFAWSSWAQPVSKVASTTGENVALASVRFVGMGTDSYCRDVNET